ncbi:MAG: hypothetical protein DHS20C17_22850 [Cyclobacteriaceae bacterium]|nr:MAG: hypothetical protein DHS20C17_22850 [Cyclobacteriaceae bacterium]
MDLPSYEFLEEGRQIRRSSKSICSNIVEGYGRKKYKAEFAKYLTYANASCDETIAHLQMINSVHFKNAPITAVIMEYEMLGRKIFTFQKYVNNYWDSKR